MDKYKPTIVSINDVPEEIRMSLIEVPDVKQFTREEFLDSFFVTCVSGMRDAVIGDLDLFNVKPREVTEARIDSLLAKVKEEIIIALEDMDYED